MNGKEVSLLAYMCSHCVMPTDFNGFRRLVHKFTEESQSEAFSECVTVLRQVVTKYVAEIDQAKRTDLLIEESISLMKSSHVPSKAVGEALIWAINCRKSAEARAQTPENQIRRLKKEVKALRDELERLREAMRNEALRSRNKGLRLENKKLLREESLACERGNRLARECQNLREALELYAKEGDKT